MSLKELPKSIESEKALLGGIIIDSSIFSEIIPILHKDAFYVAEHKELFSLLKKMFEENEPIDVVTITEKVVSSGQEYKYGGLVYVLELPINIASTQNLTHYAKIITEKAMLRRLITSLKEMEQKAYEQEEDATELLQNGIGKLLNIIHEEGDNPCESAASIALKEVERLKELSTMGVHEISGVRTGFFQLDLLLSGLQNGDLTILAARPAMGKTAFALNIAQKACEKSKVAVGVFSLEMSKRQLIGRLFSNMTQIDVSKLKSGKINEKEIIKLQNACKRLENMPLIIDDTPALSISDLRAKTRRMKIEYPNFGLILIDYLQLMRGENTRLQREQQIAEISRGLKILAKELDVPIIALSQLNRSVESRKDKRPMLSDLRESGSLEQDSDVIMFIYRDDYYHENSKEPGMAEVIIAKQRSGPTATVNLKFDKNHTRFYDPIDMEMESIMSGG